MTALNQMPGSNPIPYPDNDIDRIELILNAYEKQSVSMRMTIGAIVSSMGWRIPMNELLRLEKLLIISDLMDDGQQSGYYKALKLSNNGRKTIYQRKEQKILRYLQSLLPQIWTDADEVFEKCNIDKKEMDSLLSGLSGLIDIKAFIGTPNKLISITVDGKRHLRYERNDDPGAKHNIIIEGSVGVIIQDSFRNNEGNQTVGDILSESDKTLKYTNKNPNPPERNKLTTIFQKAGAWIINNIMLFIISTLAIIAGAYAIIKFKIPH